MLNLYAYVANIYYFPKITQDSAFLPVGSPVTLVERLSQGCLSLKPPSTNVKGADLPSLVHPGPCSLASEVSLMPAHIPPSLFLL